jgi:hypothetical protein
MTAYKSYHSYLIEFLKNPAEAAAYLDAVLEDGELEPMLLALKNVAEARKNVTSSRTESDANWEGASQFCKFPLFPQPLLPKREQGSRIQSPSPALGEGFRVRATKVGCTQLGYLLPVAFPRGSTGDFFNFKIIE